MHVSRAIRKDSRDLDLDYSFSAIEIGQCLAIKKYLSLTVDANAGCLFVLTDEEHRDTTSFLNAAQRSVHPVAVVGRETKCLWIYHPHEARTSTFVGNIWKSLFADSGEKEVCRLS